MQPAIYDGYRNTIGYPEFCWEISSLEYSILFFLIIGDVEPVSHTMKLTLISVTYECL